MVFTGCSTTYYSVEVSNIPNIREIYIRNAGTTEWGANLVRTLNNIDKSIWSERVDIRVVDTNGIVYSKHNIPFNDAAFIVTDESSTINPFFGLVLLLGSLLIISAIASE